MSDAPDGPARRTEPEEATGGATAATGHPAAARGRSGWRLRGSWADRLEVLVPGLGYAAAVLSGASTSSMAQGPLLQNPREPIATVLGEPQAIRSDEWLVSVPSELGVLADGQSVHSPLAQPPDLLHQLSSGQLVESLLFLESNLLRLGPWLPDAMLFSAYRLWPWLLVLWTLPPLLRMLGATRSLSWLGTALVFFVPSTVWWSFQSVKIYSFAAVGAFLLVLATRAWRADRRVPALLAAAGAGLFLARLVTFYVPWSITIGLPLVFATGLFLIAEKERRRAALAMIGVGAVVGVGLLVGTFWENLDAFRAQLATDYPGQRRTTGEAFRPGLLLGGPAGFELNDQPLMSWGNQSELSQPFLITALVALLLWRRMVPGLDRGYLWAIRTTAAFLAVWTLWTTVNLGDLGGHVPVLNLVPPARIAQTMGFAASLLMVLVLSRLPRPLTWREGLPVGVATAAVTAYGVSDYALLVPSLDTKQILATALVTGALAWWLVVDRRSWRPVVAIALATGVTAVTVNPVMFGLGDLRTSDSAERVRALAARADREGVHIASDSAAVNGLMVANGAPLLNGYQVTGPVEEQWEKLDPERDYQLEWNRGVSYIWLDFNRPPDEQPELVNPSPDVIQVSVHPCWLAEAGLDVGYVVSATKDLAPECLEPLPGRLRWAGSDHWVYRVR